jgi:hypothetical protein
MSHIPALALALLALGATTAAASASPSSTAAAQLTRYLMAGSDVADYAPAGKATRFETPTSWGAILGPKPAPAISRLEREGFVAAASEYTLYTPKGGTGGGISWAAEFGSANSAAAEQAVDYKQFAVASMGASVVKRYSLKGIAGSRAWASTALGFQSANVIFTEGRCLLLIGIERTVGGTLANVMGPLQSAADSVYKRTRARCP